MSRKRCSAEQIIRKLHEAEVEFARGLSTGAVCKELGITTNTKRGEVYLQLEFDAKLAPHDTEILSAREEEDLLVLEKRERARIDTGAKLVHERGFKGTAKAKLFARLKTHRRDHLASRWNRFSWFGTRRVLTSGRLGQVTTRHHPTLASLLHQLEAVLIAASEPPLNRHGGNFGRDTTRYLQVRDDRLGLTEKQMLRRLCKANDIDWRG